MFHILTNFLWTLSKSPFRTILEFSTIQFRDRSSTTQPNRSVDHLAYIRGIHSTPWPHTTRADGTTIFSRARLNHLPRGPSSRVDPRKTSRKTDSVYPSLAFPLPPCCIFRSRAARNNNAYNRLAYTAITLKFSIIYISTLSDGYV